VNASVKIDAFRFLSVPRQVDRSLTLSRALPALTLLLPRCLRPSQPSLWPCCSGFWTGRRS